MHSEAVLANIYAVSQTTLHHIPPHKALKSTKKKYARQRQNILFGYKTAHEKKHKRNKEYNANNTTKLPDAPTPTKKYI